MADKPTMYAKVPRELIRFVMTVEQIKKCFIGCIEGWWWMIREASSRGQPSHVKALEYFKGVGEAKRNAQSVATIVVSEEIQTGEAANDDHQ